MRTIVRIVVFVVSLFQIQFSYAQIPAPIGNETQVYCEGDNLTLSNASVFNTSGYSEIYWYADANQTGDLLNADTIVEDNTVYYAFQAIDPTAEALQVSFALQSGIIPAPEGSPQLALCEQANPTLADLVVFNTSGFTDIYWFADVEQITPLSYDTLVEDATTYYAFQAMGICCGYLPVTVTLLPQIPAPDGDANQYFCYEQTWTLNDVVVNNNSGYSGIVWYADYNCSPIGEPIDPNTIINDGDIYYAIQGIDNGCCPFPFEVHIYIPDPYPAPLGDTDQYFNEGEDFYLDYAEVSNTEGYDVIFWFTTPNQEDGTLVDSFTLVNDGDVYYAFQANCSCDCNLALPLEVTFHEIPLGVNDMDVQLFELYPNPVKDTLFIKTKHVFPKALIYVYNTNGRLIFKENIKSEQGIYKLNRLHLTSGVYYVKIVSDSYSESHKFVKI